jgi:hypothetical protein
MAKYRKRPALLEATQWFRNGDHPQDEITLIDTPDGPSRASEGKVVRFWRSLNIPGDRACEHCGNPMRLHGELTNRAEEVVCPGDYIVTKGGQRYKMSARDFEAMYEPYWETKELSDV